MYLYLSLEFLKLPWAIQLAMEGYLNLNQFKNKQKKAFTLQIHISSLQYSSKAKDHRSSWKQSPNFPLSAQRSMGQDWGQVFVYPKTAWVFS